VHDVGSLGARASGFEYVDSGGRTQQLAVPGVLTVNAMATYELACLQGLGIIQVPEVGVRAHIDAGRLIEILPAHRAAPMPISLVYANRRHLPRRVQVFMDWLAERMRQRLGSAES
jgi:DNA-binding transcriptional LysR family regulator